MRTFSAVLSPALVGIALFGAPRLAAQVAPGDIIIADHALTSGQILRLEPASGTLTTLTTLGRSIGSVHAVPGSTDVMFTSRDEVIRMNLNTGAQTTLGRLPGVGFTAGFCFDQDGSVIAAADTAIFRVNAQGVTPILPAGLFTFFSGVVRDETDGEFFVGDAFLFMTHLLKLDRSGQKRTLNSDIGDAAFISDHDLRTGGVWSGGIFGAVLSVNLWDRASGQALSTLSQAGGALVTVDQTTGNLITWTPTNVVIRDRTGAPLRSFGAFPSHQFNQVTVVGSRPLGGRGSAKAGGTFGIDVSFANFPGAFYALGASFAGPRPGIDIANVGRLHLAPDALFALTAGQNIPGITTGFAGTLDQDGFATASIRFPNGTPSGTRLTVAGVVLNAGRVQAIAPSIGVVVD